MSAFTIEGLGIEVILGERPPDDIPRILQGPVLRDVVRLYRSGAPIDRDTIKELADLGFGARCRGILALNLWLRDRDLLLWPAHPHIQLPELQLGLEIYLDRDFSLSKALDTLDFWYTENLSPVLANLGFPRSNLGFQIFPILFDSLILSTHLNRVSDSDWLNLMTSLSKGSFDFILMMDGGSRKIYPSAIYSGDRDDWRLFLRREARRALWDAGFPGVALDYDKQLEGAAIERWICSRRQRP